ncbi:MAG: RND transporter [endosymbiont of Galathealinum brachiosum]|uniref:RND transporter n=1 Tax=endosymbiont of Galathealinum brachiosum TaxID=2200906 RepID=A0A370DKJ0_9GAMM|nr:MAG: RND transporter [endosymbiont of Galathealinum brachiosum]
MLVRYTEWILKWRYLVIILSLVMVGIIGSGAPNLLPFSNDYRVFFSKDNPQLNAFENLQDTYTKDDNVMFVISPKNGNVFTPENLSAIQAITEEAWQIPHSIRVDSVTNFQHTYAEEDDLIVDDLVLEPDAMTKKQLDYAQQVALKEPALAARLISLNSAHTGINVTVQLPGIDQMKENPATVAYARKMLAEAKANYPEIDFRLAGMVMMNNAFPEASQADGQTLIPMAFGVIAVVLLLLLKGFSGTAATIILVICSIVIGMGAGGHFGIKLTPPSASAPIIILTIAIAGAVHLLVTMLQEIHKGTSKHDAIVESMRVNFMPIFLTTITTALGFLSLNSSDAPPFGDLGNMSTFGVLGAFALTVTFLPAIMFILPIKAKHFIAGTGLMKRLGDFVVEKRNALLITFTTIVMIFIAMIPQNDLNDVFVKYFDESIEFRRDTDFTTENLTGTYTIAYSLDSGEKEGVSRPEFLSQVEQFANWYETQDEVLHVSTITDTFKRLNKNMHGDDESYYKLPDNRELGAQYLLLYEMSLPYGLDLNNQIDVAKQSTKVNVILKTISSNELLALENRVNDWMKANTPDITTDGASPSIMFAHIGKRNIISMLSGTTIALVLISLILIIALKSVKYGLLSLIPNLFPAGVAFGIWGLVVGEVGLALSIVTAMTLGIVVDDTIHFMSKYIRARKEHNLNSQDAVRYAFNNVGVALWVTSAVLISGFMILAQSNFELNSGMGLMTSIIIAVALILDFLLLPPLLMAIDSDKNKTA